MSQPVVGYIPASNEVAGISPVFVGGDANPAGRDDVAASAGQAVANAQARYREHEADTYGQGSTIGDTMTLPDVPAYTLPPPPVAGYPYSGDEPVG
jgi:hypothetical protein